MKRLTKVQVRSLGDLSRYDGGVVMSSYWTTGSGRHTRARTIPPYASRIEKFYADNYPARIRDFFRRHPRVRAVVAITNMRAANKILKGVAL